MPADPKEDGTWGNRGVALITDSPTLQDHFQTVFARDPFFHTGPTVTRVLIPATLPGVMDTLRITMGWAWTYLVVAELVAANKGLGYMILNSMRGLFTDQIFVGIMVIGLLGLGTDQLFKNLHRWLLPWSPKAG